MNNTTTTSVGTMSVVADACTFAPNRATAEIVIESSNENFANAIEELRSVACKNLAIAYATTQGMGDPRINGNVMSAYPVNEEGIALEDLRGGDDKPLHPTDPRMQPAKYRTSVPVTRKM